MVSPYSIFTQSFKVTLLGGEIEEKPFVELAIDKLEKDEKLEQCNGSESQPYNIIAINSMFGCASKTGYENLIKIPQSEIGKETRKERKEQNKKVPFTSCAEITMLIEGGKYKQFRYFPISGITQYYGETKDIDENIKSFALYLEDLLECKIIIHDYKPILIDAKFEIIIKDDQIMILNKLKEVLESISPIGKFYVLGAIVDKAKTIKLKFKLYNSPSLPKLKSNIGGDDIHKPLSVHIFQSGKVNILGAKMYDYIEFVHKIFDHITKKYANKFIVNKPKEDSVINNLSNGNFNKQIEKLRSIKF